MDPPLPAGREQRRIVTLLSILVALVALLVVGLGVAGLWAARKLERVDDALAAVGGVREAAVELTQRQARTADALSRVARRTDAQVAELYQRAEEAKGKGGGPIKTVEKAVTLSQLLVDLQIALMHYAADTQEALAEAMRPLPAQREATGVGGSGREADPRRDKRH